MQLGPGQDIRSRFPLIPRQGIVALHEVGELRRELGVSSASIDASLHQLKADRPSEKRVDLGEHGLVPSLKIFPELVEELLIVAARATHVSQELYHCPRVEVFGRGQRRGRSLEPPVDRVEKGRRELVNFVQVGELSRLLLPEEVVLAGKRDFAW